MKMIFNEIKHIYQRAKKGYSYRDLWSIDHWFMETIPKMLRDFMENLHGCPNEFIKRANETEYTDQEFELGMSNWKAIVKRMIFCFSEMNEDTCSMENEFKEEFQEQLLRDLLTKKKPKKWERIKKLFERKDKDAPVKLHPLVFGDVEPELEKNYRKREEEIENYREKMKDEGFDLLKKYFWILWD